MDIVYIGLYSLHNLSFVRIIFWSSPRHNKANTFITNFYPFGGQPVVRHRKGTTSATEQSIFDGEQSEKFWESLAISFYGSFTKTCICLISKWYLQTNSALLGFSCIIALVSHKLPPWNFVNAANTGLITGLSLAMFRALLFCLGEFIHGRSTAQHLLLNQAFRTIGHEIVVWRFLQANTKHNCS